MLGERIGERDSVLTDAERLRDRRDEQSRIRDRRQVDEDGPVAELRRKLLGCRDRQPRLARPTRTGQRHEPDLAAPEQSRDGRDLEPPSDQRRRGRGKQRRRRAAGLGRGKGRVMAEDRALQLAEPAARLDAELVDQHPPRGVIRLECLLLPAGAVQRDHVLLAQPFPEGLGGDQPLELADEGAVLTQCEVSLVPELERTEARVIEGTRLDGSHGLVREVGQSRTAPELESCLDVRRRIVRGIGCERPLRALDQPFESLEVQLTPGEPRPVARAVALDPLRAERAPEPVHVHLECPRGRIGRLVGPNRIHEMIAGDDRAARQQELREQCALLRRAEAHRAPVDEDFDRAKDPELVHRKQPLSRS